VEILCLDLKLLFCVRNFLEFLIISFQVAQVLLQTVLRLIYPLNLFMFKVVSSPIHLRCSPNTLKTSLKLQLCLFPDSFGRQMAE